MCLMQIPFWYWQNIELYLYYVMYFKERNHNLVLAGALGSTMYSSGSIQSVAFKAFKVARRYSVNQTTCFQKHLQLSSY